MTLGFGTAGIVGGSVAAGIQATIGNVAAGSIFAVCTSLGMSGVFASTAAVGAILGAGGLAAYIKGIFSPEKDANLIHTTIENNDNPEIIIKLLEGRFPSQREEIRLKYNELCPNNHNNFDEQIINYVPDNLRRHTENLLINTNDIPINTENIRLLLNNATFEDYCKKEFNEQTDAILIDNIIENNDNPLIIIRLLNYRNEEQRKKIDLFFREIKGDTKAMKLYIIDFMPNNPEITYLNFLLE